MVLSVLLAYSYLRNSLFLSPQLSVFEVPLYSSMIGLGVSLLLIYLQNCKSNISAHTDHHYVCSYLTQFLYRHSSKFRYSLEPKSSERWEVMDSENYVDYEIPL